MVVGYVWMVMAWLMKGLRIESRTQSHVEVVDKALERVWHCQTWYDIERFWMDTLQRLEGDRLERLELDPEADEPKHDDEAS